MLPEPKIQIGNYVLSEAQAMAVRVAVSSWHSALSVVAGDQERDPVDDAYRDRLTEVLKVWLSE